MKKYRWQLLILFFTGLVVGVLLILEKRGGLAEVSTAQPVQGGVYTEALVGNIQRLNPLLDSANSVDRDINKLVFSGIVKFDSRGIPQPDLAETIGISQDGMLYNIALKPDLVWHDGKPLTTQDVLFTIDLMRNGGSYIPEDIKALWDAVEVYLFDEQHMQLKLPEPYSPFIDYLTFGVIPQHLFKGMNIDQISQSSLNLEPVGSGPYRFDGLLMAGDSVNGIRLKAFEKYAGEKPFLQEIIFSFYPDTTSAFQAYQQGLAQGVSEIPPSLIETAMLDDTLNIFTGRLPRVSLVLLNLNNTGVPFFQDADIRNALLLGINRTAIVAKQYYGQAIVANGVILPGTWAYNDTIQTVGFDPQLAAEMLKEAGYLVTGEENPVREKEGVKLSFVLSYPDDDIHQRIAQMIADNWKELNVDVSLEAVPPDVFVKEKLEPRAYQAALVDLNLSRTPDPDPYPFWDLGQAESGQNYSQWNNRLASDSIEQARVTTDLAERTRLYHNFQAIFAEEMPALPLFFPVYNYGVSEQIHGVTMGPLFDTSDRLVTITEWYLATSHSPQTNTSTPDK